MARTESSRKRSRDCLVGEKSTDKEATEMDSRLLGPLLRSFFLFSCLGVSFFSLIFFLLPVSSLATLLGRQTS